MIQSVSCNLIRVFERCFIEMMSWWGVFFNSSCTSSCLGFWMMFDVKGIFQTDVYLEDVCG